MNIFKAKFKGEEVKIIDGKPHHVATWECAECCENRHAKKVMKEIDVLSREQLPFMSKQVVGELKPSLQALKRALTK